MAALPPGALMQAIAALKGGQQQPVAAPTPDPYEAAIKQAQTEYPRLSKIPFALTHGEGPFMSETYEPGDSENPIPGKWTIQLRNKEVQNDPPRWPDFIALESLHALQADDPKYQDFTKQFVGSMTDAQKADAKRAYKRDQKVFGVKEPYDKWLSRVQAQEYIRGMVFPHAVPGWTGKNGEGKYTKQQLELGQKIDSYMRGSD